MAKYIGSISSEAIQILHPDIYRRMMAGESVTAEMIAELQRGGFLVEYDQAEPERV